MVHEVLVRRVRASQKGGFCSRNNLGHSEGVMREFHCLECAKYLAPRTR